jgi:hypothetical protein
MIMLSYIISKNNGKAIVKKLKNKFIVTLRNLTAKHGKFKHLFQNNLQPPARERTVILDWEL